MYFAGRSLIHLFMHHTFAQLYVHYTHTHTYIVQHQLPYQLTFSFASKMIFPRARKFKIHWQLTEIAWFIFLAKLITCNHSISSKSNFSIDAFANTYTHHLHLHFAIKLTISAKSIWNSQIRLTRNLASTFYCNFVPEIKIVLKESTNLANKTNAAPQSEQPNWPFLVQSFLFTENSRKTLLFLFLFDSQKVNKSCILRAAKNTTRISRSEVFISSLQRRKLQISSLYTESVMYRLFIDIPAIVSHSFQKLLDHLFAESIILHVNCCFVRILNFDAFCGICDLIWYKKSHQYLKKWNENYTHMQSH